MPCGGTFVIVGGLIVKSYYTSCNCMEYGAFSWSSIWSFAVLSRVAFLIFHMVLSLLVMMWVMPALVVGFVDAWKMRAK